MAAEKTNTVRDLVECLRAIEEWLRVVREALGSIPGDTPVDVSDPDPSIPRVIRGKGKC
jgi:hypothetical protein